jgi:outer membrane protein OmpA-like peptidoglycan-associated protein
MRAEVRKQEMPRYDAYAGQPQPPSVTRGWFISALTGSLVVHAGLAIFFNFKTLENFGPLDLPPAKAESTLHRVKIIDEKPNKKDEVKTVLPDRKTPDKKKDLTLPKELPAPDEISVSPKHKQIDTSQLFADEKPVVEMAKLSTTPKLNQDDLLPKLDDSFFNSGRTGPKVGARYRNDPGPDGDGTARAIQVAGQNVEGILSGLTSGKGTSRRLSLPGNLTFGYDNSDVSNEGRIELDKIAEALRKFLGADLKTSMFTIEGHTDPTGTPEYNLKLSERRAESVRAWFVANMDVNPDHVKTIGYGATRPAEGVPLDGTIEEMQGHRRTEIVIRRPKK